MRRPAVRKQQSILGFQRTQSAVRWFEDHRNLSCTYKKAASSVLDAAVANAIANGLEGEIHTCADHAEIVLRPIHEIPAKVADPADMRGEANFHAAADLPDRPRLAICMTGRLDDVETFSRLNKPLIDSFLAPAKDGTSSAKNIWRKASAMDRIPKSKGA